MTIDWEDRRAAPQDGEMLYALAQRAVEAALDADGLTHRVNVGITLVDDEEIAQINAQFRGVDAVTDVLSFPMHEVDIAQASAQARPGDIDPATGELLLGDIVVAVERARAQAVEYGHSFQREFGFLVVHGMLHLMGYDHMTVSDEQVMRAMQQKVLSALNLSRGEQHLV